MGVFDDKPRATIQDFFQYSYDVSVFNPVVAGQSMRWLFIDLVYEAALRRDKSFARVEKKAFRGEMLALRMELIGMAMMHVDKEDAHLMEQSVFTKEYLARNGAAELWDTMGEYNNVIALSAADMHKSECPSRITTTMSDYLRLELAKGFLEAHGTEGTDLDCKVRVCNRCGCDAAWEKGVTARWLVATLSTRLGCDETPGVDALVALEGALMWFYQSDKETMSSVSFS